MTIIFSSPAENRHYDKAYFFAMMS